MTGFSLIRCPQCGAWKSGDLAAVCPACSSRRRREERVIIAVLAILFLLSTALTIHHLL